MAVDVAGAGSLDGKARSARRPPAESALRAILALGLKPAKGAAPLRSTLAERREGEAPREVTLPFFSVAGCGDWSICTAALEATPVFNVFMMCACCLEMVHDGAALSAASRLKMSWQHTKGLPTRGRRKHEPDVRQTKNLHAKRPTYERDSVSCMKRSRLSSQCRVDRYDNDPDRMRRINSKKAANVAERSSRR
jgi:hypothetical protein